MGFQDLIVWQKGVELSTLIYKLTEKLPEFERFGISSQMQRAAVSIPSNIAEGHRRNNTKEYKHFCGVALGSAAELQTQLIILGNVHGIDTSVEQETVIEIQRMLSTLIKKLSTR